jgi:O-antigen ligase
MVLAVAVMARPALPRWVLPMSLLSLTVVGAWLLADGGRRDDIGRAISRSGDPQEITTFTGRDVIWDVAVEQISRQPLTGIGAGSTPEVFRQERLEGRIDYVDVVHAHDLWLQLGMSGGVPAMVSVGIGALGFTVRAIRRPVRDRDALMIATLVHGITEDVVAEPRYTLVIVAAAFASVARHRKRNDRTRRGAAG